ncbi:Retrotransposable element Tf2 [Cucumis melo var. makuwa]|uniref:Retrotransposable element Tf2 n=1 Tax=Cucumis melo var. makuwa TaxID=1194695 RepID=A0A5A7SXT0_CUCMM|nr:Retrotransposable element Tf2 [Cucumis melo var. makuwa]TYK02566.1 Retrotransposable element Tf2 [Cucumis melo var. makuwa]
MGKIMVQYHIPCINKSYSIPFQLVFGTTPFDFVWRKESPDNDVEHLNISALKENLNVVQNRMKKLADLKRRTVQFAVGDEVYLKLRHYRQRSLARKRSEKLAPKFYGTYEIVEKVER